MTIELKTQAAAHALADYLRRCECSVLFVDDLVLEVSPPQRSQTPRDALIEIEAYVSVWKALHPNEHVAVVRADGTSSADGEAARELEP
jgi:hypothetical protein